MTASTSIKPLEYAKETILGMTIAIEQQFGCTPRNDVGTTLNTKLGVFQSRLPTAPRYTKYFCWGNGGRLNDTDGLSSAQYVAGTNMSLYSLRPFRAMLLANDLSAQERANYAMRVVKTLNGVSYVMYYLKKIDFSDSTVQYVRTDPNNQISTTYELDTAAGLNPTPPATDDNGVITDVADQVSVVLPGVLTVTGEEILEVNGVLDGGDTRYAILSEIGFVSAATETVSATDHTGAAFTYQEAIMAQLVNQYDWVGQPFLSTEDSWSRTMQFSVKNTIVA